jgi:hypothetical protein
MSTNFAMQLMYNQTCPTDQQILRTIDIGDYHYRDMEKVIQVMRSNLWFRDAWIKCRKNKL